MATWNELLRQARKQRKLSQQALASQAQVSRDTLSNYENYKYGTARPTRDTLLKLTSALRLDRAAANEILAGAGFDPLPTGRLASFERRSLPVRTLEQEIDSYSWPCLGITDQMEILLANPPTNWVAELDLFQAFPELPQRHLLRISALQHFRDRVENWNDVVSVIFALLKADFADTEAYAAAMPWFQQLLADLETRPEYAGAYARILDLWEKTQAKQDLSRTTFHACWRVSDGTLLQFNTIITAWSDFDAFYSNDWQPADGTTIEWLAGKRKEYDAERAQLGERAGESAAEQRSSLPSWSELLQQKRDTSGLTQARLAHDIEVTEQAIFSYEAGRRKPSRERLLQLARALFLDGATTNLLLTEAGHPPEPSAVARSLVGEPTFDPRFPLGRWEALLPRTVQLLPSIIAKHPWPCLVVDARCQIVAANAPMVRVLGTNPRGQNLLQLLLSAPFRDRLLNDDQVLTALAPSGLREALTNQKTTRRTRPFLPLLETLRQEDPRAAARLRELWEAAPPARLSTRAVTPLLWQHPDGPILSFNAVVSLWSDYAWYWALDLHPADAPTWEWLTNHA